MAASDDEAKQALPPLDFSGFILSLSSSAMVNLGVVAGPDDEPAGRDLAAAKQIIDILAIIEEKTRGNLQPAEQKLLESLLYDLRVHFVDASKVESGPPSSRRT